jgi:chromate reductase, NAD(P)H dehydrogenase (quinone)
MAVNVAVMSLPEAYLHSIGDAFNAEARLVKDTTREFLTKFMRAFSRCVEKLGKQE